MNCQICDRPRNGDNWMVYKEALSSREDIHVCWRCAFRLLYTEPADRRSKVLELRMEAT